MKKYSTIQAFFQTLSSTKDLSKKGSNFFYFEGKRYSIPYKFEMDGFIISTTIKEGNSKKGALYEPFSIKFKIKCDFDKTKTGEIGFEDSPLHAQKVETKAFYWLFKKNFSEIEVNDTSNDIKAIQTKVIALKHKFRDYVELALDAQIEIAEKYKNIIFSTPTPKIIMPFVRCFIQYCLSELGVPSNTKVEIRFKPMDFNQMGIANYSAFIEEGKLIVDMPDDSGYKMYPIYLSHELTHIKQFLFGELLVKDEHFYWKGKRDISVNEYNLIGKNLKKKYKLYENLGWEKEALQNQESIPKKFYQSQAFKDLVKSTTEPNLSLVLQYMP